VRVTTVFKRLLCLDEPSSGLNSEEVGRLMDALRRSIAQDKKPPRKDKASASVPAIRKRA
jgi:non-homologous end joining protein Ku